MPTIKIALHTTYHTPSATGYNVIAGTSTGTHALNDTNGNAANLSLQLVDTFSQLNYSGHTGDLHGIPENVIKGGGLYTSGTVDLIISGSASITDIKVWGISTVDDGSRITDYDHNAVTTQHDARNSGAAAPVSLSSLGANPKTITVSPASGYAYLTYIEITTGAATPTVSSAEVSNDGQSVTVNFSESVSVGAGGSGGWSLVTSAAGLADVTMTYSSGAPGSALTFGASRIIQNGEPLYLNYTQPGNGIEATDDGADLATIVGSDALNRSQMHRIFSNAVLTTAVSSTQVYARILNKDLTVVQSADSQTLWSDANGYIQVSDTHVTSGNYRLDITGVDSGTFGTDDWWRV